MILFHDVSPPDWLTIPLLFFLYIFAIPPGWFGRISKPLHSTPRTLLQPYSIIFPWTLEFQGSVPASCVVCSITLINSGLLNISINKKSYSSVLLCCLEDKALKAVITTLCLWNKKVSHRWTHYKAWYLPTWRLFGSITGLFLKQGCSVSPINAMVGSKQWYKYRWQSKLISKCTQKTNTVMQCNWNIIFNRSKWLIEYTT